MSSHLRFGVTRACDKIEEFYHIYVKMREINNISILPNPSEYIMLSKLPLSERFNNITNSLLISLGKAFLVCCPETRERIILTTG